jgi:GT2 family glycosyltransferase
MVSVITVNYNGWKDTCELIASFAAHETFPYEIIVVDNASKGDDLKHLEAITDPHVKLVRSALNLGFAGGNNLGMQTAKGEALFFLNNDTVIRSSVLTPLVARLESDPAIAGVSPMIRYFHQPDILQYYGDKGLSSITIRNKMKSFSPELMADYIQPVPTEMLHGAAMMFKRDAIKQVGNMTEVFFLFYEELDWSRRFRQAGYMLWYEPAAIVYHKASVSIVQHTPMREYYLTRSRMLYARRNLNNPFKRFLSCLYLVSVATPSMMLRHLLKGKPSLAWAVCRGCCSGLFAQAH